jgi:hypothetical protein
MAVRRCESGLHATCESSSSGLPYGLGGCGVQSLEVTLWLEPGELTTGLAARVPNEAGGAGFPASRP